jgi:hypothetical protein
MLIQMLIHEPQMLGTVLKSTPGRMAFRKPVAAANRPLAA